MPRNQSVRNDLIRKWRLPVVAVLVAGGLVVGVITPASASDGVADPIADAVREALDAWAEYATTGDLLVLGSSFVRGGPQFRQLEGEAANGQPSQSVPPLQFDLHDLQLRSSDTTTATVWVEVEARRDGFVSEVLGWDFDLIRDGGRWLVWTVVPAAQPTGPSEVLVSEAPTTLSTTTTTTAPDVSVIDRREADHEPPVAAAGSSSGTRIPVLSAWIVVVTVVGVAVAGYLAPRFDGGGGR